MADRTPIEWADSTWNVINGCSVVSPGCTNCYAMRLAGTRFRNHPTRQGLTTDSKAGPVWNGQVRLNEKVLTDPLRWTRPRRIFVCAHGDLFHENVPDEWIDRVFAVMALAPRHVFQVLTKRPERMRAYLADPWVSRRIYELACDLVVDGVAPGVVLIGPWATSERAPAGRHVHLDRWPLPNVWLGVSAEDQTRADERIPILLDTPAAVRWLSAEPLLGPVDISRWTATARVTCKSCSTPFDLHAADPCRHKDQGSWTLACPSCGSCVCRAGWSAADDRAPPMGPPLDWPEREVGRFTRVHPTIPLHSGLGWVVAGGESGPGARPMHPDWARQLRDQCADAGVPFLFKQWGDWLPCDHLRAKDGFWTPKALDGSGRTFRFAPDAGRSHCFMKNPTYRSVDDVFVWQFPKKIAGRLLDGQIHDAFPEARS